MRVSSKELFSTLKNLTKDARCLFESGSSRWPWYQGTFFFLSFKSAYAFRDRFGFVNGLKQMQVGLLRMKQSGTFDDYIHAFSSSTSQVKYLHDRTRALLFTSGFASDLRKEVLKEYPKKLPTAKRLAREANGTVQLLSSMNTRTTVRNEKNEQAPATAT